METPDYITKKLKLQTNADAVDVDSVCGERLEYTLYFSQTVGFNWLNEELGKAFSACDTDLQRYQLVPATDDVVVTVRETEPRPNLETGQHKLDNYE